MMKYWRNVLPLISKSMIEIDILDRKLATEINIDHKYFWIRFMQNPKFSWKHNNTLSLIFSFLIATFYWNVLKCSLKQYALLTDNFGRFMCTQTYFGDQISNIVILKNTSCTQNRLLCCYKNQTTVFMCVCTRVWIFQLLACYWTSYVKQQLF